MSAPRTIEKSAVETALEAAFAGLRPSAHAAAAFGRFEKLGVPGRRVESWHYTDLRTQWKAAAPLSVAPSDATLAAAKARLASEPKLGARLVLVDGRFVAELSDALPVGVALQPGAPDEPVADNADAMLALTAALAQGGFTLTVAAGADGGRIEIVHLTSGASASYARFVFELGERAKATIIERCLGASAAAERHRLIHVALAHGARLDHAVSLEDAPRLNLESVSAELAEDADLTGFGLALGGGLTRRQMFIRLNGRHANLSLAGLSLIDGERRVDTTLEVTHAAPQGTSREFFRSIVADEGQGAFQGKVIVAPQAQKTDGAMKSQAILLSPTASMNNKPELEIFADDVACGHGATVGALDREQVFYLQSRGIPADEAEAMLLEAFGVAAIERIADVGVQDAMLTKARAWLQTRSAKG